MQVLSAITIKYDSILYPVIELQTFMKVYKFPALTWVVAIIPQSCLRTTNQRRANYFCFSKTSYND